ncbi:RNA polymerase III subunit Rpc25-domain-containing protein [Amylocarpus encephaloides]|uniref:DNA-directed RNA polymerase subunit n=1 Tax=Amylocarpus encephaloides TaxID=45428 RepID=A0A9P7YQ07_9HELO|nr:RNA polymerase III subunit Rpc25-domain-containing protein [Amylocarpus encephaloides]
MFILTKIADLVQIVPEDFEKEASQAIEDNINAKYANRVIQKIGLCICLYDLLSASEGLIGHGTGLVNVNVEFRLIVFRPFKHEVLLGKISSATPEGIRIRTNFFKDIFVPQHRLPEGAAFNDAEQVFTWTTEDTVLYYDNHETVRFRVEEERWHDQAPTKATGGENDQDVEERKVSPYGIIASMEDSGMGPCLWWDDVDVAEEVE